ncbi:hypothetical protein FGO68_gene10581 [Halteria grandinella]|uniref:Uncharacterized protein n=1 Tax=Halteria grandinella TaxID=5974 RepID=A0A8J8T642_HALGN|nr:hypothetical protein FGO68_gene10581 [Halteria grandinella]
MKVKRACIYIYRLAPTFLHFLNHYGILFELENGERVMLHNSPNNKTRYYEEKTFRQRGHEIYIHEKALEDNYKWELLHDWQPVQNQLAINQLIRPGLQYKFFTTNCIHTVKRSWRELHQGASDRKIPKFSYIIDYRAVTRGIQTLKNNKIKLLSGTALAFGGLYVAGKYVWENNDFRFRQRNERAQ